MRLINSFRKYLSTSSAAIFILVPAIFIIYLPSWHFGFVREFDEGYFMLDNTAIHHFNWHTLKYLFFYDQRDCYYLPLQYASLSLDISLFGFNPFWMRMENIGLHAVNTLLTFFIARHFLNNKNWALLCAVIFAVHPMQVENIVWVVSRRQVLSAAFFLSCYLLYCKTKFNSIWSVIMGLLLSLGAYLAKPTAIILPLVFVIQDILEYYYNQPESRRNFSLRRFGIYLLFFAATIPSIVGNINASANNFLQTEYHYTIWQHVVLTAHGYIFYLQKFLLPFNLTVMHFVPSDDGKPFPLVYTIRFLSFSLICIGVLYAVMKKSGFLPVLFLCLIFTILVPTANPILLNSDFPQINAERYFYQASVFVVFLFVYFLQHIYYRINISFRKIFVGLNISFVVYLLVVTEMQIPFWESDIKLLEHNLSIYPNKEFYERLAVVYYDSNNLTFAKAALLKAQIAPPLSFNNHAFQYASLVVVSIKTAEYELAEEYFARMKKRALEMNLMNNPDYIRVEKQFEDFLTRNLGN